MTSRKRKLADDITGGTGDFNPQTYVIHEQISEVTNATASFPLPIPRFGAWGKDKSIVFELLGVTWHLDGMPAGAVGQGSLVVRAALTTNPDNPPPSPLGIDPRVICTFYRAWNIPAAGTTVTATTEYDLNEYQDLSDSAGHGILVATDNIFLAVHNTTAGGPMIATDLSCSMKYRMKEVTLQEYVGIVQSQQ